MVPESSPERRRQLFESRYPTPQDWERIQGGQPIVLYRPKAPRKKWLVLHVYDQHPDEQRRFRSGHLVDTLPKYDPKDVHLTTVKVGSRNLDVPSFMLLKFHGDPCTDKSRLAGGDDKGYPQIQTQQQYEELLDVLDGDGYSEVQFRQVRVKSGGLGYSLIPKPLRRPVPLGQSSLDEQ